MQLEGWAKWAGVPTPPQALSLPLCSLSLSHHPEMPQRISQIMCRLEELGLAERCFILPARPATDAELLTCHRSDPPAQGGIGPQCTHATWELEPGYIELLGDMGGAMEGMEPPDCPKCPLCASSAEYVGRLRATEKMKTRELHCEGASFDSIYICPSTFACAKLATGATCCLVEAVLAGEVRLLWGGALAPRGGPGGWREVAWKKLGRA